MSIEYAMAMEVLNEERDRLRISDLRKEKRPHRDVFEYDGAFKCGVCGGHWGAISGPKIDPNNCVGSDLRKEKKG